MSEEVASLRQELEDIQLSLVREREAHKDTKKAFRDETLLRTQLAPAGHRFKSATAADEEHRRSLEEHQHSQGSPGALQAVREGTARSGTAPA